jgi:hypothetical protein
MGSLLRQQPATEAVVLAWPLVCGSEVAARTRAVAFAGRELTVEVADPAWRRQLASFDFRYVAGFAELLGPVVGKIRFVKKQSALSNQQSAGPHA